jgi:hypothetical protein
MAIRKDSSRFSDRNTIRRMNAEGYPLESISAKTSISIEHIQYVIDSWTKDEEKAKDLARQAGADKVQAEREAAKPTKPSIDDEERARIVEVTRREVMAELEKQQKAATPAPTRKRKPPPVEEAPPEDAEGILKVS